MNAKIAAMILAAGQASRFGRCKQLAEINGQPMLQYLIDAAAPLAGDIHIISGRWHTALQQATEQGVIQGAALHYNPDWHQGMGRSIAFGVTQLAEHYDGVLVLLSDQPALTSAHITQLLHQFDSETIICSYYQHRRGAPALFPARYFPALMQLQGDKGAQSLLKASESAVIACPIPEAAFDIDRPADLYKYPARLDQKSAEKNSESTAACDQQI
ncbi:MAG: nucleotidyltransferase family protein [Marinobacterium sp.]|nr:nucleotidyltransferase family protein [Marinobacterium sp.]